MELPGTGAPFPCRSIPMPDGRYILRFWSIDYYIEVWVNGHAVGHHECVDTMVEFDITAAVRPGAENLVAVRVVNPSNTPIDGMVIRECPGRNRIDPWSPGACYNNGGIIDSVELLVAAGRAHRIAVCRTRLEERRRSKPPSMSATPPTSLSPAASP